MSNTESRGTKVERLKACSGDSEITCVAGAKGSGRKPSVGDECEKASSTQTMKESSTPR